MSDRNEHAPRIANETAETRESRLLMMRAARKRRPAAQNRPAPRVMSMAAEERSRSLAALRMVSA